MRGDQGTIRHHIVPYRVVALLAGNGGRGGEDKRVQENAYFELKLNKDEVFS